MKGAKPTGFLRYAALPSSLFISYTRPWLVNRTKNLVQNILDLVLSKQERTTCPPFDWNGIASIARIVATPKQGANSNNAVFYALEHLLNQLEQQVDWINNNLKNPRTIVTNLLSSSISSLILYPLYVCTTTIISASAAASSSSSVPIPRNISAVALHSWRAIRKSYEHKGIGAFFAGLLPHLALVVLEVVTSYAVTYLVIKFTRYLIERVHMLIALGKNSASPPGTMSFHPLLFLQTFH
jgi:hypothetical protein